MGKRIIGILSILLLVACQKQVTPVYVDSDNQTASAKGVFVINEGNFQWGNGSLGIYDRATSTYSSRVFQNKNGIPLGDVPQSLSIWNGKLFIPINSSSKMHILDGSNFELQHTIEGLESPRYLEPINDSLALITDLRANQIHVFNYNQLKVTDSIEVGMRTEKMLRFQNKIFITTPDSNQLYIYDTELLELIDSIEIAFGGNSLALNSDNKLFVLVSPYLRSNPTSYIYQINPFLNSIDTIIQLDSADGYNDIQILNDAIYYSNNNQIQKHTSSVTTLFETENIYAFAIDSENNEMYIANAKDFVQNSIVYRTDTLGSVIDSFESGIITGEFLFNH